MLRKFLLTEKSVALSMIDSLEIKEDNTVLELSGNEILIEELAKRCTKLIVFEENFGRISKLQSEFLHLRNVEFVHSDLSSLEGVNFEKLISGFLIDRQELLETIIIKISKIAFSSKDKISASILISNRLMDILKSRPYDIDYGYLSFLRDYLVDILKEEKVFRSCFLPRPGYDGFFILMKPKKVKLNENYLKIAKMIFMNKNQTLQRSLLKSRSMIRLDKKKLKEVLEERLPKFLNMKVFELDTKDILEICEKLGDIIDKES